VTLEYFLLFAAVTIVAIAGFTSFGGDVIRTVEDFFNAAAAKITN